MAPDYSSLELHTPSSLIGSPHLPALFKLINSSFNHCHNKDGFSFFPWSETTRLQTFEQLGEEVGSDGFTLIMLMKDTPSTSADSNAKTRQTEGFRSPDGQRVIGTASAKPYTPTKAGSGSGDASHHFFKRPPPDPSEDNDTTPKWELLAMAVDISLQGKGLASQLMNLTIDEIKRRCGSGLRETSLSKRGLIATPPDEEYGEKTVAAANGGKVKLLLSTMRILNEGYYAKRGWTATNYKSFPPGTMDSRDGFEVVDMYKNVDL